MDQNPHSFPIQSLEFSKKLFIQRFSHFLRE